MEIKTRSGRFIRNRGRASILVPWAELIVEPRIINASSQIVGASYTVAAPLTIPSVTAAAIYDFGTWVAEIVSIQALMVAVRS